MAAEVFGIPLTKLTLELMLEYEGKEITRHDLGREAYRLKNAENKAVTARAYVHDLMANHGAGACTKCIIYNATGDTITLVGSHHFDGSTVASDYRTEIANGQWAAFLHTGGTSGSSGAVVYRLKGVTGLADDDCMIAWSTASDPSKTNRCYAEFSDKDQFNDDTVWGKVETKLSSSGHHHVETCGFFQAEVTMGNHTNSDLVAILKVGDPY